MRSCGILILLVLSAFAPSCSPDYVERLVEQRFSGPDGDGPEAVAAWVVLPHACVGCVDLTLVAFSDDRVIWRDVRPEAPALEQLRTLRAPGLVESLLGSEEERASLVPLGTPDLPETWRAMWFHHYREALCIAGGRGWTCHALTNPFPFLLGRTVLEACHSNGPRAYGIPPSSCETWHAYHAEVPEALAARFRRAYDLMHSSGSSSFFPAHVTVQGTLAEPHRLEGSSTLHDPCGWRGTAEWPSDVPTPEVGTGPGAASSWTLPLSAIEAARLSSAIRAASGPVASCVSVHGQQWTLEATFRLPNVGGEWRWNL